MAQWEVRVLQRGSTDQMNDTAVGAAVFTGAQVTGWWKGEREVP